MAPTQWLYGVARMLAVSARASLPRGSASRTVNSLEQNLSQRWTIAFIAFASIFIIGFGIWREQISREQQITETGASLANLATSLSQHADDAIEMADALLVTCMARLQVDGISPATLTSLERLLTIRRTAVPSVQAIVVVGEDGRWLASSLPDFAASLPDKESILTKRDYFQHHQNNIDLGVYVGLPIRNLRNGRWSISVSRRLNAAEGRFAGVVVAIIDLSRFSDHYAQFDLGTDSSLELITTAGILLTKFPTDEADIGRDISNAAVFSKLREQPFGHYEATSVLDGVRRIFGYRASGRLPLIILTATSKQQALAAWRSTAIVHLMGEAVLAGIVGLLGLFLVRHMRRGRAMLEALRTSEQFLDRTGCLAGVGGWEVNLATGEIHWSAETCRMHGMQPGHKPTLEQAINFYAPEVRPVIAAALERCKAGGGGWDLELPLNSADGRQRWVHVVGSAISVNDQPARIAGALQDITDRVTERLALERANERVTLATDSGAIGIWDWDIVQNVLVWNPWMYRLYGLQPQAKAEPYALWADHLHPDDRAATEQVLRDGLSGGKPFDTEFRVVWDDGSVHHLRGSARVTRDAAGHALRMIGANWDISRQRIEEQQRAIIIEAAPNGMMIVDEAGIITLANSQLERIFGYPNGALIGQKLEVLVPEGFRAAHATLRSAFTCGRSDQAMAPQRQLTGRKCDGSAVIVEILLNPVKTPHGRIVIASMLDVTDRVRQATELQKAEEQERLAAAATNDHLNALSQELIMSRDLAQQANRAKSNFLAGMSHELRTPLNGVIGYAQLLHLDGGMNDVQSTRVDAILGAGRHLLRMIEDVLSLSEIEAKQVDLKTVVIDLNNVVGGCLDVIRPMAKAKRLALGYSMAPDVPRAIWADATRLRQVLLNLLGNALKFTHQGAVELRVRTAASGSRLRLEVADTGPGVPEAKRGLLFQRFERLDSDGTRTIEGAGLGLSLSEQLAALIGGQVGHEDNPGGGSVFWLEIPLNAFSPAIQPAASAAILPGPPASAVRRALYLLVVDDVAMNRDIACSMLRAAGHTVECVAGGAEAVAAVASTDFDVVLMDVRMPEMDGIEATRRIRSLQGGRPRVPIVALTAQAFAEQVAECRAAGMDGHLSKPFDQKALLATVSLAAEAGMQRALQVAM